MKKYAMLVAVLMFSLTSFSQVQRKIAGKNEANKTGNNNDKVTWNKQEERKSRLAMMKELDLTKEQRGKIKELHLSNQSKKVEIMGDEKLAETQKRNKLKEIKRDAVIYMQAILNDEQRAKIKAKQEGKMKKNENELSL